VILAVLGSRIASIRRSLAAERAIIDRAWAQVDAALQHRAELAPDLAQALEAGAPGETDAAKAVTSARTALDQARGPEQKIRANTQFDNALARLLLLAENYPKLEASKEFADLQDELREAEYRIAVERRKYNEAVEHYNTRIALFPDNVVAALSRFGKIDAYFQTSAAVRTPPKVAY
jgi:LemA protein